ncbi:acetate--CoA ligase family protein [Desulfatitalea alkaliphila]|uniref:CoA-binding protein n=1 Tax=Desulfatitalea alkaliphila TaxID=2929485 RepID=A0AA41UJJ0_9BACT|nr:CoA-binding protein [Desulfatitalea alkaliphila]
MTMQAMEAIFRPRAIAVVGASDTFGKWGHRLVQRPLQTGYPGAIYPINHRRKEILGLKAYPDLASVPGPVDLAVVATPTETVPQVLRACVARGIKGAVVITAGFAETGEQGARLQEEMTVVARSGGIRLVGPNCMGIWSAAGELSLCFPKRPKTGPIAFVSQSGTFGVSMAQVAATQGYGLSKFISIGNQADLEVSDYLDYLAEDDDTRVIVLYLEGLKDGARFFDTARRVVRRKPIIVYKAGRSAAAERAAMSHTASIAGSAAVFDSMCRQIGLLQAAESFHLFEMAQALSGLPLPRGNRVAILGSGGQGVVGTDACTALGIALPELDADTARRISALLPGHAPAARNPVDFAGSHRTALQEAEIIEMFLKLDYIDGVISNVPVSPQLFDSSLKIDPDAEDLPEAVRIAVEGGRRYAALPRKYGKPVICLRFAPLENDIMEAILGQGGIPVYSYPEQCARGMGALVEYAKVRRRGEPGG